MSTLPVVPASASASIFAVMVTAVPSTVTLPFAETAPSRSMSLVTTVCPMCTYPPIEVVFPMVPSKSIFLVVAAASMVTLVPAKMSPAVCKTFPLVDSTSTFPSAVKPAAKFTSSAVAVMNTSSSESNPPEDRVNSLSASTSISRALPPSVVVSVPAIETSLVASMSIPTVPFAAPAVTSAFMVTSPTEVAPAVKVT